MSQTEEPTAVQGELRPPTISPPAGTLAAPIPGTLTRQLGSGEHAQNSIVYRTILWSFVGGGLLSAAAVVLAYRDGKATPMSEIKEVWSIFAPLITLALGYVFGKGR